MREPVYILKYLDSIKKDLIIEEDEHSIWTYLLDSENDNKIILDGFICSIGTIVENTSDVKEFIDKGFAPPISKEYANAITIQKDLTEEDFRIELNEKTISIYLDNSEFTVLDLEDFKSYSKSIMKAGPYGLPLEMWNIKY